MNLIIFKVSKLLLPIFLVLTHRVRIVTSNGRFLEPPNRSSIWRFPEFKHLNPPQNYNDNHLDCGGTLVEEDDTKTCGICGDPISEPVPRPNEDGGEFSKGIIVRTYKAGQEIPVTVQLTYGQKGYFDFRLCAKDDTKSHLDRKCYEENILQVVGNKNKNKFMITEAAGKYYNLTLALPGNVKCNNCVLRWRYRAGNNWAECGSGKPGALGCGPQTSFYGCSDIAIV